MVLQSNYGLLGLDCTESENQGAVENKPQGLAIVFQKRVKGSGLVRSFQNMMLFGGGHLGSNQQVKYIHIHEQPKLGKIRKIYDPRDSLKPFRSSF